MVTAPDDFQEPAGGRATGDRAYHEAMLKLADGLLSLRHPLAPFRLNRERDLAATRRRDRHRLPLFQVVGAHEVHAQAERGHEGAARHRGGRWRVRGRL